MGCCICDRHGLNTATTAYPQNEYAHQQQARLLQLMLPVGKPAGLATSAAAGSVEIAAQLRLALPWRRWATGAAAAAGRSLAHRRARRPSTTLHKRQQGSEEVEAKQQASGGAARLG